MDREGVGNADLIIEAVPEKLETKAEGRCRDGAEMMAVRSRRPTPQAFRCRKIALDAESRRERLVGLHFFNPVPRLQLVEVVSHDGSDPQSLTGAGLVGAIHRLSLAGQTSRRDFSSTARRR